MTKPFFSEREMMEDGILTQKQMTTIYNTGACESVNQQLCSSFVSILAEEQDLRTKLFEVMSERGWHQPKEADESKIALVKQKFINH